MKKWLNKILPLIFLWSLYGSSNSALSQGTTTPPAIVDTVPLDDYADNLQQSPNDPEDDHAVESWSFREVDTLGLPVSQRRQLPDSFINNLKKDKDFSYVASGLEKKEASASLKPARLDWLRFIPYIALAIFIGLLIWYLASNDLLLFKKKSTAIVTAAAIHDQKDIFAIHYAQEIRAALQQKDYRLAIRLQYLEVLKTLSDKQLIQFMPDKTNYDYLEQMQSAPYYNDFFNITRNYEYSWYGLFNITESMYKKIDHSFHQFKQKLIYPVN